MPLIFAELVSDLCHLITMFPKYTCAGIAYMFTDSQISMAVILRLMRENIPALPMHDGMMVQQSAKRRAKAIMEEEALRITGVRLPVAYKVNRQLPCP